MYPSLAQTRPVYLVSKPYGPRAARFTQRASRELYANRRRRLQVPGSLIAPSRWRIKRTKKTHTKRSSTPWRPKTCRRYSWAIGINSIDLLYPCVPIVSQPRFWIPGVDDHLVWVFVVRLILYRHDASRLLATRCRRP